MENEERTSSGTPDCCDEVKNLKEWSEDAKIHLLKTERRFFPGLLNFINVAVLGKYKERKATSKERGAALQAFLIAQIFTPKGAMQVSAIAVMTLCFQFVQTKMYREEINLNKEGLKEMQRSNAIMDESNSDWKRAEAATYCDELTEDLLSIQNEARYERPSSPTGATVTKLIDGTHRWSPNRISYTYRDSTYRASSSVAPGRLLVCLGMDGLDSSGVAEIAAKGNFTWSNLAGLKLDGFPTLDQLDLSHSFFVGAELTNLQWYYLKAKHSIWDGITIRDCDFFGATRLDSIRLVGATADNVDFSGVSFDFADLTGFRADEKCQFLGASFNYATMEESLFNRIKGDIRGSLGVTLVNTLQK